MLVLPEMKLAVFLGAVWAPLALTPAGSKVVRVIAADKILADFGLRLWRALRAPP